MAATCPFSTDKVRPLRIFLSSISTCKFLTSRKATSSPHKFQSIMPFQASVPVEFLLHRHCHSPSVRRRHNSKKQRANAAISTAQTIHAEKVARSTHKDNATSEPATMAAAKAVTSQPSHVAGAAP